MRTGMAWALEDAFLFTLVEVVVGWSLDGEELASYEILRLHSQMSAGGRTLHHPWMGDETCHAETT